VTVHTCGKPLGMAGSVVVWAAGVEAFGHGAIASCIGHECRKVGGGEFVRDVVTGDGDRWQ
jgi:hypothetical protein